MAGGRAAAARPLLSLVRALHPNLDAAPAIAAGEVLVDGVPVTNPRSRPRPGALVQHRPQSGLRGEAKLSAGLEQFAIEPAGAVALDVGASTGGFTSVLLARGARRVYAVDAGHGQLLGRLRQDPRVVNLEATNLGALDLGLVPDAIDLLTVDVSYLPLGEAVAQLTQRVRLAAGATLLGLVKPMFELRLGAAPRDGESLQRAIAAAEAAIAAAGWELRGSGASAQVGAHGAVEGWVHAARPPAAGPSGAARLP